MVRRTIDDKKEILKVIINRDKCKIDLDKITEFKKDTKIEFECSCGIFSSKSFIGLEKYGGGFCKECTKKNKQIKIANTCIERYGKKSTLQVPEIREKINQTNIQRYGSIHCMQCPEVREKGVFTCNQRYNCDYPIQSKEIRDKGKITLFNEHGVEFVFQVPEVREKILKTIKERYNETNASKNEEIKEKIRNTCFKNYGKEYPSQVEEIKEKISNTCIIRYGYKYATQNEEIKQKQIATSIKNYGTNYPMQNAEFAEKQSKKSYKLKEFKFSCGNIIKVQGYEPYLLELLVNQGYSFDDIKTKKTEVPEIWYFKNNKKCRYYCDIYIKKNNTIYEVKSTWTYSKDINDLSLKKQACIDFGFNFELYVFDRKGNRVLVDI